MIIYKRQWIHPNIKEKYFFLNLKSRFHSSRSIQIPLTIHYILSTDQHDGYFQIVIARPIRSHVSSTLVEISSSKRTQSRLIDRSREHKGFETKKKKKKNSIARHWDSCLEFVLFPGLDSKRDANKTENRTDRKAERKRVPQRELRISWEKCEGKVSWMAFATIHSFYLLFRRSNSPLSAKPIGFPSILLDRLKRYRPFFFFGSNKLSFQFVNIDPLDYSFFSRMRFWIFWKWKNIKQISYQKQYIYRYY